jgi:RHS repeat-associated protein
VAKGELYSSARFVNGNKFEIRIPRLDTLYRPRETQYSIPAAEVGTELGRVYRFTTSYNRDGTVQSNGFEAAGGLPAEAVAYTYDDMQRLTALQGVNTYLTKATYAQTGELLKADLSTGGRKAWATFGYEQGTGRLLKSAVTRQAVITPGGPADPTPVSDVDQEYSYDPAGNVLSIADTPGNGQRDIQCFRYDYLRRMTEAWTSASVAEKPCTGDAVSTGVGGVAPYHHSYEFDAVGNRLSETVHAVGGAAGSKREYTYPEAGETRPHGLVSVTDNTPAGDKLHEFHYDAAGNTTKRLKVGEEQSLVWDAEGTLASVTEAGATTSYVYTADGDRLVRREPGATTLYLPGMELRLDTTSRAVAGTRYYPVTDAAAVVRSASGLQFQFNDRHGTGQIAVDAATGSIARRWTTPFGSPRGVQPDAGSWLGEKGFVGGTQDSTTGLTQLGARMYDPLNGRFLSVDPIIDVTDPQQMNAYAYSNNSPVTYTDPNGLKPLITDSPQGDAQYLRDNNLQMTMDSKGKWNVTKRSQPASQPAGPTEPPEVSKAKAEAEKAKQELIAAGKELGKIIMDELGITAGLDCLTNGNMDSCVETLVNIGESFVGGFAAKLARKYGMPWKWKKAAELGKKLWDLGGKIFSSLKTWWKNSRVVNAFRKTCEFADNSFEPGTLVLLADGERKPIEDVDVGDQVLATDPETGQTASKTVVATIIGDGSKDLVRITVDAGAEADGPIAELVATHNHPFWVPDLRDWVDATELHAGQWLQTSAGTRVQVTAVERWTQTATVHNLTVDDIHTYYVVAADTPLLVHNCGPGTKFNVPASPGVYTIHMNDGTKYVGSSIDSMRSRVNKSMRSKHAVRKKGYKAQDVTNVTHIPLPAGVTSKTARRVEQTVMEGLKARGVTLLNRRDPEIEIPFGGYLP